MTTTYPLRRPHAIALPALMLLLMTQPASADLPPITAEAGTDFPISISAGARAELPGRIQLVTSVGFLPEAYVEALNEVAVSAGWYDENTAALIRSSLKSSLVVGAQAGWRPLRRYGFYANASYRLVTLGGDATGAEIITGTTGQPPPPAELPGDREYDVSSTLHMLGLELGWSFRLPRGLSLRVALGGAFTVSASTRIEPKFDPRNPLAVNTFAEYGERYLDDTYTSYVHPATVSMTMGYRF